MARPTPLERAAASRKLRALRLLLTGVCVIGVAVYQRVSTYDAQDTHMRGSVAHVTPAPAVRNWAEAAGVTHGRRLLSAGLTCEEAEHSCTDAKAAGETTLMWNLVYWPVMLYSFYGLAIVCDDFFVASLEIISMKLKLSEDVAGATFMAAGSSAPELFTSAVDVFWFQNNVGVGTIVGSAVFNVLVIIALSAISSDQALLIDWKPLSRDCFFYSVAIVLLVTFTETDKSVVAWEAACLVAWYVCYIIFMMRNKEIFDKVDVWIEQFAEARERRAEAKRAREEAKALEAGNSEAADAAAAAILAIDLFPAALVNSDDQGLQMVEEEEESEYEAMERRARLRARFRAAVYAVMAARFIRQRLADLQERRRVWQERCAAMPLVRRSRPVLRFAGAVRAVMLCRNDFPRFAGEVAARNEKLTQGSELERGRTYVFRAMAQAEEDTAGRLAPYVEPEIPVPPPTTYQRIKAKLNAALSLPWGVMLGYTIPNCEKTEWRRWYMLTFLMSIVWIGILSAVLVETASRIGCTLGIPTVVMGLTVLAAGTSVPDALGSIVVARDGMGNMAVSNAIGSNVFDICLGIGLPYLIKTAIVDPTEAIPYECILDTEDIVVSIALLGSTVVIVWLALVISRWRLTKPLGYVLLVFYAGFIAYTLLKPSACAV